jgi:2'-5' RNA ligase
MYEHSSTHILLPDFLANEIFAWGEENVTEQDLYTDSMGVVFGRETDLHVTILGGLHLGVPDEVRKLVTGIPEFEIELQGISIFTTNDLYDVVKVDVRSEGLRNLHKKMCRFPHTKFYPVYKPHVTIGYIKKDRCEKLIGANPFSGRKWLADAIIFSSKRGNKTTLSFKTPQVQVS